MQNFILPRDFPKELPLKIKTSDTFRYIKLRFDSNGNLVLNLPKYATKEIGESFLASKLEWILEHYLHFNTNTLRHDRIYLFGEWIEFDDFIEQVQFAIAPYKNKEYLLTQNPLNIIWQSALQGNLGAKKILETSYRAILSHYITPTLKQITHTMQTQKTQVQYGKSFWQLGCCYARLHKIRFSIRLVFFPKACINSVIIHELAHLTHQNHGKAFWELVKKYDKNPKYIKQWSYENRALNTELYQKIFKS